MSTASVPSPAMRGTSRSRQNATFSSGVGRTEDPFEPTSLDVSLIGWQRLESKYYELKYLINAPTSGLYANDARVEQKRRASAAIVTLLESAQKECRKALLQRQPDVAMDGGFKTLKLKQDYYGEHTLQLVPCYFHLARSNQYIDKFKSAEEFLSLAQWIILQNPEAGMSLKAELHQTFGLLYASDSKLDAALKQLTCAAYYLSVLNGPEHILTSLVYFDLGNVFAAKGKMENAMGFYDKTKYIWYNHLTSVLKARRKAGAAGGRDEVGKAAVDAVAAAANTMTKSIPYSTPMQLGEENMQDAVKILLGILSLQKERYGDENPSVCLGEFVVGLFFLFNYDATMAEPHLLEALRLGRIIYGLMHDKTLEIRNIMISNGLRIDGALEEIPQEKGE